YEIVKMAGALPVVIPAGIEQDFKCTPAQIEAAITDRTKFILYSSPCNPSGSVFSYAELEAMSEMLQGYDHVMVFSDEIYEHIRFGGPHHTIAAMPGMKDR